MIDKTLETIAPHYCCGCQKVGSLLCLDCKNNIIFDKNQVCLLCLMPCKSNGLCEECHKKVPYSRAWFVKKREGEIEALIDIYKFKNTKSACSVVAELLDSTLPYLPHGTLIVPVPTIAKHIRQRGYDHTLLIARQLAKKRGLKYLTPLSRLTSTSQLGKTAKERRDQASQAFGAKHRLDQSRVYLLIDDIFTTGSTVYYSAKALRDAGASDVWVAVVARQVLG